ncbi:hypothetical protein [Aureivirga sp. CE67]|uniref:hypothetical protein n=1 Tax=Aureivirga sp. CE67 TaxID=1788983 RepID=UPI0018CB5093|nr:hypothetical protein [Aureivirga sp. CE67]
MNKIIKIFFGVFFLVCTSTIFAQTTEKGKELAMCCIGEDGGRCVGKSNCKVCTDCSRCKHCKKDGGNCGVCSGKSSSKPSGLHFSNQKNSDTYLKIMYVNVKFCSLQAKPINDASSKMTMNYGEELIFLAKKGKWVKVKVKSNSKVGYIKREKVEFKK